LFLPILYPLKFLFNFTIFIFAVSGLNGFLIEEGFFPINRSILSFLLDILLCVVAFFSLRSKRQIIQILVFFSIFLSLTIVSFFLNDSELTIINYLNGIRDFLPYFLFPIIFFYLFQSIEKQVIITKFNNFLYLFLFLQIPVSLYQFSVYGAGDMVGGTQGSGYSGNLTFIVFLSTFYLMTQGFDGNNIIRSFLKKSYLLIFWLPAFINETKISFVLISLFLFLLVKLSISNIPKYIFILILLLPSLYFFNSIYQKTSTYFDSTEFLSSNFLEEYLVSDEEYSDIPRFQKVVIFLTTFNNTEIFFGKGIGQFKGGSTLAPTPFASQYEWLLLGSIPMLFFLLVQIGIIGAIWFILFWFFLISQRPKQQMRFCYSTNLIVFITTCYILVLFYDSTFRFLFSTGIYMYILCYSLYYNSDKINYNNSGTYTNKQ